MRPVTPMTDAASTSQSRSERPSGQERGGDMSYPEMLQYLAEATRYDNAKQAPALE